MHIQSSYRYRDGFRFYTGFQLVGLLVIKAILRPSQSDVHTFFLALRILRSIPKDALIKSSDPMRRRKNIMGKLIHCRKWGFPHYVFPPVMEPATRFKSEYMQDKRLKRLKEEIQA